MSIRKRSRIFSVFFSCLFFLPVSVFAQEIIEGRLEHRIAENIGYLHEETVIIKDDGTEVPVELVGNAVHDMYGALNKRVYAEVFPQQVGAFIADGKSKKLVSELVTTEIRSFGAESHAETPQVRSLAAIVINFTDVNAITNVAGARSILFEGTHNVADHFHESSKGKVTFAGEVFGPYTINQQKGAACNPGSWMNEAKALLKAEHGEDALSGYQHVMAILPKYNNQGCSWAGLASLGGGNSWMAEHSLIVYSHELGHNLGFHHAAHDANNDGVVSGVNQEYGDNSDPMGLSRSIRHFGAPHASRWFPEGGKMLEFSELDEQDFSIASVESENDAASNPQFVKLNLAAGGSPYYVSFRQARGSHGGNLPSTYRNKVLVHRWGGSYQRTMLVKVLSPGHTFHDSSNGFLVRYDSYSGTTAAVSISLNPDAADTDNDGIPNGSDPDDDNDGVLDGDDCAQYDENKYQTHAYSDRDYDRVRDGTELIDTGTCFGSQPAGRFTLNETELDNCPDRYNPDQSDTDGDGIGDACDEGACGGDDSHGENDGSTGGGGHCDTDKDGVPDSEDCAPRDALSWTNWAYPDPDGDGVRNSRQMQELDACFGEFAPEGYTLTESSGVDNCPEVSNPEQADSDGDGVGDACDDDNDRDGDGVVDEDDCAPDDASKWRDRAARDTDGDGVSNTLSLMTVACFGSNPPAGYILEANGPDNCPETSNPNQEDADEDGKGDACDSDADGDGVNNEADCAPRDAGKWRNRAARDTDGDGVSDTQHTQTVACFGETTPVGYILEANGPDNCPEISNPEQEDADGDGRGDACDSDTDGDGVNDEADCAPHDGTKWRDTAARDTDSDGISDTANVVDVACYGRVAPDGYLVEANGPDNCIHEANANQSDIDEDGSGDACDSDMDGDNVSNGDDCAPEDATKWRELAALDSDGDGVSDTGSLVQVHCYGTSVPEGYVPLANGPDNCVDTPNPDQQDSDGDHIGDACDTDTCTVETEGCDFDGDGTSNEDDCAPSDPTVYRNIAYMDEDLDRIRDSERLVTVDSCFADMAPEGYTLHTGAVDNCPGEHNPNQADQDEDGIGDICDADRDGDGVANEDDCAADENTLYRDRAALDSDGDGVSDTAESEAVACFGAQAPEGYVLEANGPDNCPNDSNPQQEDRDNDGVGDACDDTEVLAVVFDFNGDRVSDIASMKTTVGTHITHEVHLSPDYKNGFGMESHAEKQPVHADYDGDGITDFAFVELKDRELVWTFSPSSRSAGATTKRFGRSYWGRSVRAISGCDFDGDGKADLTVSYFGLVQTLLSATDQTRYVAWSQRGVALDRITCANLDGEGGDEAILLSKKLVKAAGAASYRYAVEVFTVDTWDREYIDLPASTGRVIDVTAADRNGDGQSELLLYAVSADGLHSLISPLTDNAAVGVPATSAITPFVLSSPGGAAVSEGILLKNHDGVFYMNLNTEAVEWLGNSVEGDLVGARNDWQFP